MSEPFHFTDDELSAITEIRSHYPERQAALLPVLRMAQERAGWLSAEVMEEVARVLDLPPAHVAGIASFYTLFHKKKAGNYVVQICRNLSCSLLGAEELIAHAEQKLGAAEGQTSANGRFTLQTVECIAACDGAPCLQIGDDYHLDITPEKFDAIIDGLP